MTAGLLPERPMVRDAADPGLSLRLLNLPAISSAYGEDVAGIVAAELCARSFAFCDDVGFRVSISIDGQDIRLAGFPLAPLLVGRWAVLESLLGALASRPVFVDGFAILVALSADIDGSGVAHIGYQPPRLAPGAYRRQMEDAAAAFEAIAEGRLFLGFQPIRAIDGGELLYHECLSRIAPRPGELEVASPASFIPAIESLGLIRLFDRCVVRATMDALRAAPPSWRLGCNISAQSVIDDAYWASILEALAARPDVARRLVIEITETSALPDLDGACRLVERLRKLGCQVAVDDFGAGFRSIRELVSLRPDIVKIDASFLTGAVRKAFGDRFLSQLIALSASLSKRVVVEGVEDERGMAVARAAGAQWVQGHHVGEPLALRRSLLAAAASAIEPATRAAAGGMGMVAP